MPDVSKAFGRLAGAATAEGILDTKTKELIALAIGIAARCDGCVGYHARARPDMGPYELKFWRRSGWRSTWVAGRP